MGFIVVVRVGLVVFGCAAASFLRVLDANFWGWTPSSDDSRLSELEGGCGLCGSTRRKG